jgi:thiol-disulfide isomerase/thioredoxin
MLMAGLLSIVTVTAACGSSGGSATADTVVIAQQRPVSVTGTALAPQPEDPTAVDPAVGVKAPTLEGATFDGTPVKITPGTDGNLMVVFLAHWCPHCQKELPRLVEWINSGAAPKDLKIVAVATATTDQRPNYPPSTWITREGWTNPVMADSDTQAAAQAYGLTSFPFFVLVKADGTVALRDSGEKEIADVAAMVTKALG